MTTHHPATLAQARAALEAAQADTLRLSAALAAALAAGRVAAAAYGAALAAAGADTTLHHPACAARTHAGGCTHECALRGRLATSTSTAGLRARLETTVPAPRRYCDHSSYPRHRRPVAPDSLPTTYATRPPRPWLDVVPPPSGRYSPRHRRATAVDL